MVVFNQPGAHRGARVPARRRRQRGSWLLELVVAMGILTTAIIPLAYSFIHEQRACRAYYHRAVAMEIVDGEMEILAAGEWKAFKPGAQAYATSAASAKNLPPGQFQLTLEYPSVRLEWIPKKIGKGGPVVREIVLPSGGLP